MRPTFALSRNSALLYSKSKSLGSMVFFETSALAGRPSRSSSEALSLSAPRSALPPAPCWIIASVSLPSLSSSACMAPGSMVIWPTSAGLICSGWRPSSGRSESISKPEVISAAGALGSPLATGFAMRSANSACWTSGFISISLSLGRAASRSTSSSKAAAFSGGLTLSSGGGAGCASTGATSTGRITIGSVRSSAACSTWIATFIFSNAKNTATWSRIEPTMAITAHQPRRFEAGG